MLVRIRLMCTGRKRINTYRIVVISSEMKRDSLRYLCNLGYYLPQNKNDYLKINLQKYNVWIKHGAQPTKRVEKLYIIAKSNEKYHVKC